MSDRKATKKPLPASELSIIRDELKSMGDILRAVRKDLDLVAYSSAKSNQELEVVKTELRLIRSDLAALDKAKVGL